MSGFLSELGYDVTLVDPYDGFGNGPTDYQRYVELFPHVKIVREYFRPGLAGLAPQVRSTRFFPSPSSNTFRADTLPACFEAIAEFLSPAAEPRFIASISFCKAAETRTILPHAQRILAEQESSSGRLRAEPFEELLERLRDDVETFFLSPQGHHHWRGGRPYAEFPFRKVVSLQTMVHRARGLECAGSRAALLDTNADF